MSHAPSRLNAAPFVFSFLVALSLAGISSPASAQSDAREGADINWHTYMQHSSTASAIAMALSYVDNCSEELGIFEEEFTDPDTGEDLVILSFSCSANEDEEGSAFLRFFGTRETLEEGYGPPVLKDFQFAG